MQDPFNSGRSHENKELALLFEISQHLDKSTELKDFIDPVLTSLAHHMNMNHGALTLSNRETGDISIFACYGLSKSQQWKGHYKPGEGVTGKVFQTGQAVVVPRISEEKLFLNRTGAHAKSHNQACSFLCVPIKIGNEPIGSLSVDHPFCEGVSLEKEIRLLSIISSMIAQAIRLRQSSIEAQIQLQEEHLRLQNALQSRFRPENIIGNSKAMHNVYDLIGQVSKSNTSVLILGESGTGKELVASALHYNSLRTGKPFIKVNCAALPETIIESELFGHEKGAFSGAITLRKGRFELAHKGTIFLDEVGDFSPSTQIKLLRVLQEREFERVGGITNIKTDVRVIAATNRNLEELIGSGQFRNDLYYRLNVFPIHVPPLRQRKTDILLLANYFVERYCKENHKRVRRISTPAIDMLMSYHWPGNVRELENCIERAVLVSEDEVLHGHYLPLTLQTAEATDTNLSGTLQAMMDNLEREFIIDALKSARGNQAKAAKILGITERVMGLRIQKHHVEPKRFRDSYNYVGN